MTVSYNKYRKGYMVNINSGNVNKTIHEMKLNFVLPLKPWQTIRDHWKSQRASSTVATNAVGSVTKGEVNSSEMDSYEA